MSTSADPGPVGAEEEFTELQRQRAVRLRMALPYEAVLEQARVGDIRRGQPSSGASSGVSSSGFKGSSSAAKPPAPIPASRFPIESAVYCTAVLECVCCALLEASTEAAQDDPFWERRGKLVSVAHTLHLSGGGPVVAQWWWPEGDASLPTHIHIFTYSHRPILSFSHRAPFVVALHHCVNGYHAG